MTRGPRAGLISVTCLLATALLIWLVFRAARAGPVQSAPSFAQELPGLVLVALGAVAGAAVAWSRTSRRSLSFGEFKATDDKAATGLASLAAAAFAGMAQGPPRGIDIVRASDVAESPVAQVAALAPNRIVTALLALWKALVPATDLTLDAQVIDESGGSRLVVVALRRRGRTIETETLPARLFPLDPTAPTAQETADRDVDLANATAAWLLVLLTRPRREPRLYGAQRWEGLALNAAASRRLDRQDYDGAQALLARASQHDPENLALTFGWQNLRLRTLHEPDDAHRQAVQELRLLYQQEVTGQAGRGRLAGLPLGWRITYGLGAAAANLAMAGPAGSRARGLEQAQQVLHPLAAELSSSPSRSTDRTFAEDLRTLTDAALLAIAMATATVSSETGAEVSLDRRPLRPRPREQYNLACAAAAAADRVSNAERRRELHKNAVTRLRITGQNTSLLPLVRTDPWFRSMSDTPEWKSLLEEWRNAERSSAQPDYAAFEAIGKLAPPLVDLGYTNAHQLRRALASEAQLKTIKERTQVDDRTLRYWTGALAWHIDKAISSAIINSVQRAGFPDQAALADFPAAQAVAMAAPWHRAAGRPEPLSEDTIKSMGAA